MNPWITDSRKGIRREADIKKNEHRQHLAILLISATGRLFIHESINGRKSPAPASYVRRITIDESQRENADYFKDEVIAIIVIRKHRTKRTRKSELIER